MSIIAAKSYTSVALDTGVRAGDPHQLVTMLYDGALAAVNQARAHLRARHVAEKGAAIGKAIRIIDEGLKISLDQKAGGQLAQRLLDLYEYLVMRLLQANIKDDEAALSEVALLLGDLRDSWAQIRPQANGQPAQPAPAAERAQTPTAQKVPDTGIGQSAPTGTAAHLKKQFGAALETGASKRLTISA